MAFTWKEKYPKDREANAIAGLEEFFGALADAGNPHPLSPAVESRFVRIVDYVFQHYRPDADGTALSMDYY